MPLTIGLTGMDPATEATTKMALNEANARLGSHWKLVPENEADYVVVDMDSMYGPMSWLRLHAAGKSVIGLTSAARTQTDHRLARPLDQDAIAQLLQELAAKAGKPIALPQAAAPAPPKPAPAPVEARTPIVASPAPVIPAAPPVAPPATAAAPIAAVPKPAAAAVRAAQTPPPVTKPSPVHDLPPTVARLLEPVEHRPAGLTPAPQPQDQLPEEITHAPQEDVIPPPEPTASAPVIPVAPPAPARVTDPMAATHIPAAWTEPAPLLEDNTPAPPKLRTLADWLTPGQLDNRVRFARGGQSVLIDSSARQYFGPIMLKPLAPLFEGAAGADDFKPLNGPDWTAAMASQGPGQPLARLVWLGALLSGNGKLAPGYDLDGRFQLLKWPQTEREFPKHFRIATAMMKGPASLPEIATASGVALADVTDFVNANLATGFAEQWHEPEPEPDTQKSTGLFGRLRGR